MCLIIKTDTTLPISKPLMEHWCEKNGDGWGMMWLQNNAIQIHRSMEDSNALWDKYQELKEFNPIIHLRWRTHGDTDLANCHPYYCGSGIFLMHNGVLSGASNYNTTKSDTWHFIEEWIKSFFSLVKNPHEVIRSKAFRKMFEQAIGFNNRIVMGDRGGFIYFNEAAWHTIDNENTGVKGLLVSNTYAWDSVRYGKPVIKSKWERDYHNQNHTSSHSYYSHDYSTPTNITAQKEPIKHIDGTYRNRMGQIMTHIVGNIYTDQTDGAWVWTQGLFQRIPEIDKNLRKRIKKELKKNKGLVPIANPEQQALLLPSPVTEVRPIIVVNEPNTNDETAEAILLLNKDEYNDILVKQWHKETSQAIHSLVYAEPEDAAIVICKLMGKA